MPIIRPYQSNVAPATSVNAPMSTPADFGVQLATPVAQGEELLAHANVIAKARARQSAMGDAAVKLAALQDDTTAAAEAARKSPDALAAGHVDTILQGFDDQKTALINSIADPDVRIWASQHADELRHSVATRETAWQGAQQSGKLVADHNTGLDLTANSLYTAPSWGDLNASINRNDSLVDSYALEPDQKDKLKAGDRSRLATSFLQGLGEKDPYAARELINSGQLNPLIDAKNMSELGNRVDSEIKGREAAARAAAAQARAEAAAAEHDRKAAQRDAKAAVIDQVHSLHDYVTEGGIVDPKTIGQYATAAYAADNSALGASMEKLATTSATNTYLRTMTPVQVQAFVLKKQKAVNDAGPKASESDLVQLNAGRNFLGVVAHETKVDPLMFASKQGVVQLAPLDPNNPASFAARQKTVTDTANHYGVPVAPLTSVELDTYRQIFTNGTTADQLHVLSSLQGLGDYTPAAMKQIGESDPALAHAGSLLHARYGTQVAADALNGMDLLKKNPTLFGQSGTPIAGHGGTGRSTALADFVGGALARQPQFAASLPKIADGVYAARWSRAGGHGYDEGAFLGAVNSSLGAFNRNGVTYGGIGTSGDVKVWLPDEVSQTEFDDAIANFTVPIKGGPIDARGRPMTADQLRALPIVTLAPGEYAFKTSARGDLVPMANGKEFVLSIGHKSKAGKAP